MIQITTRGCKMRIGKTLAKGLVEVRILGEPGAGACLVPKFNQRIGLDIGFAIRHASAPMPQCLGRPPRSEEHTSELQSLMRISYAVFCLKKKNKKHT